MQELICIQAIDYFANYHSKSFYHGDIKPDNLLIYDYNFTSDAGTLLYLGNDESTANDPRYVITSYTLGYASKKLV